MGYSRPDDHFLDTTLSTHVPPTGKTLMIPRDDTLTAPGGGVDGGATVAFVSKVKRCHCCFLYIA